MHTRLLIGVIMAGLGFLCLLICGALSGFCTPHRVFFSQATAQKIQIAAATGSFLFVLGLLLCLTT